MGESVNVFLFTNDLRVHDNQALANAVKRQGHLICLFCYKTWWFENHLQQGQSLGHHRAAFLTQSLMNLGHVLDGMGQTLLLFTGSVTEAIEELERSLTPGSKINSVFRSFNVGVYENREWQSAARDLPLVNFEEIETHTLFKKQQLEPLFHSFDLSYSQFRKRIESSLEPLAPIPTLTSLPPPPSDINDVLITKSPHFQLTGLGDDTIHQRHFWGGETRALNHLTDYFSEHLPAHYKEVRNSLDGWENSTKLSAWLSNGCLSVRLVYQYLKHYEARVTANESTYWVYFELLWREYFQWSAYVNQEKLFAHSGTNGRRPLTSFYSERFAKWCSGTTPYPIVNACMNQLNSEGYLSNRGRQIVASCFVNELSLDWRYGAAYFESTLLDYDVASNWGNWQYLAGVGSGTKGKRHFDLEKQARLFDKSGEYCEKWGTDREILPLDSVDMADWPA